METFHGGLREAKELLELAVKRYPTDDRVWSAYEEFVQVCRFDCYIFTPPSLTSTSFVSFVIFAQIEGSSIRTTQREVR